MLDTYLGPTRLETRKPYSFSPYHGDAFVDAHREARAQWIAELQQRGATVERFGAVLDPRAPRDDADRRHALDVWLQRTATESLATQPLDAGAWSERIGRAHLDAKLPLIEDREANWSFETIEHWVQRFEAFGCVHTLYDGGGRRVVRDPNRTPVVLRLSFATAWAAVSARDAAQCVILLNALLKMMDLLQAQVLHGGAGLDDDEASMALATLLMERRVLDRVSTGVGRMSEGTAT